MAEHVVGKYEIGSLIGKGVFGRVFRAQHRDLGRTFAIKFLQLDENEREDAESNVRARFRREAKILGQLDHPNTVQVVDFGEYQGRPYLVMEYLEGRSLREVLREEGALDEPRIHALTLQLLGSVAQAHSRGLVHRDLKPTNIMVVRDPQGGEMVKVLDFGVATAFRDDGVGVSNLSITAKGSFVGTPQYAAPEQFKGTSNAASDVYSIGLLMWELATGRQAVTGGLGEAIQAHTSPKRWTLPAGVELSAGMRTIIETALERDPARRYPDAGKMKAAMEKLKVRTRVTGTSVPATQVGHAGLFAGKYEMGGVIGSGGFSRVYKAMHVEMARSVAVKVLDLEGAVASTGATTAEDLRSRFGREARLVARLQHPNTITVHDFGVDGGSWYIVMEFVEGRDLQRAVDAEGKFEPRRAAKITRDIARSLSEAHHLGILHRDMKPGNVMLTKDFEGNEVAKVLDFGIAVGQDVHATGQPDIRPMQATRMGQFVGTPQYAAPEQYLGESLTPAADLYSLGLVLWEMLVGRPAVDSAAFGQCLSLHLSKTPWTLPDDVRVPPGLQRILNGLLAKNPDERYGSASEVAQDLDDWLSSGKEDFRPSASTIRSWDPAIDYAQEQIDFRNYIDDLAVLDPNLDEDSLPELLRPTKAPDTSERRATEPPAPKRPKRSKAEPLELDYAAAGIDRSERRDRAPVRSADVHVGGRERPFPVKPVVIAAVVLVVGAVGFSLLPDGEPEDVVSADELMKTETMHLQLDEPKERAPEPTNRFTSAGILEAMRAKGWSARKMGASNALSNVSEAGYRMTGNGDEFEMRILTTKSNAIAAQMADETRAPIRAVRFDNKVVRIFPPTKGEPTLPGDVVSWLQTYRSTVLDEVDRR